MVQTLSNCFPKSFHFKLSEASVSLHRTRCPSEEPGGVPTFDPQDAPERCGSARGAGGAGGADGDEFRKPWKRLLAHFELVAAGTEMCQMDHVRISGG